MDLASVIDHTLLKPEATAADVVRLCEEALEYGFYSVCVNHQFVALAASILVESPVMTCAAIGFPLGATTTATMVAEACGALADGARELDMVMALGAAKAGEWHAVETDIAAVVEAVGGGAVVTDASLDVDAGAPTTALVKVIIECCLLTDEEKVTACEAAVRAGAAYVKTSTGFSTGGATVADVRLMRQIVGSNVGVKASGGIKTAEDALSMLQAGATRLGTSNCVAIVKHQ